MGLMLPFFYFIYLNNFYTTKIMTIFSFQTFTIKMDKNKAFIIEEN